MTIIIHRKSDEQEELTQDKVATMVHTRLMMTRFFSRHHGEEKRADEQPSAGLC